MKPRLRLSQIILIVGTIIIFGLIIFFFDDKKALSVVLTTISGCAVIYAIIFEGELKKENKAGRSRLTGIGLFLIILYIAVSFGNGYTARNTIIENENQTRVDSIKNAKIITDLENANQILENQRVKDSLDIEYLKGKLAKIDTTLIINAIKELEEQRKIAEEEKERIFSHFKAELVYNMRIIYYRYNDSIMNTYINRSDGAFFVTTALEAVYLNQYASISEKQLYIHNLSIYANYIKVLDDLCQKITHTREDAREYNIEAFKSSCAGLHNGLFHTLSLIQNFDSYKEYESVTEDYRWKLLSLDQLQNILHLKFTPEYIKYYNERIKELSKITF